ncbi:MAG TPA: BamA/TamA family outer membrane protein, partial [Christiangramia sp.]|nr:BamA/TamA family outer membrane protein [Christiangramia sp.]
YVRNLNPENYFNVYQNSYEELNDIAQESNFDLNDPPNLEIPDEADEFIDYVISDDFPNTGLNLDDFFNVLDIYERKLRLTENNLIFATNYTYLWNTREGLYDQEFSRFRFKIETAGNVLSLLSGVFNYEQNDQGFDKIIGVAYSQYIKTEIDFIKHWDLGNDQIFAARAFGGIAIPYGNSNSIPITKTFFGGGPNDNRAWQAYDLGPGSSGSILEFNEANMKLAFNGEYRFGLIDEFKGALFVDVGNIWNALDNFDVPEYKFEGIEDLKELAVGSGFGLRYDFNFFVLRFDIGFKTHDPAQPIGKRWFRDYNFSNAVYNVGINYPF